jgi:hypothetical protein
MDLPPGRQATDLAQGLGTDMGVCFDKLNMKISHLSP